MRSTTERMKLLKIRTDEINKRRTARKHAITAVSCYSFCIAFIVIISLLVSNLNFAGYEQMRPIGVASIFINKPFLGYIVVGILAFLLGISVTLMCDMLHKRKKTGDREHDRTDG